MSGLTADNSDHDFKMLKMEVTERFEGLVRLWRLCMRVDKRTVWGLFRYISQAYIQMGVCAQTMCLGQAYVSKRVGSI